MYSFVFAVVLWHSICFLWCFCGVFDKFIYFVFNEFLVFTAAWPRLAMSMPATLMTRSLASTPDRWTRLSLTTCVGTFMYSVCMTLVVLTCEMERGCPWSLPPDRRKPHGSLEFSLKVEISACLPNLKFVTSGGEHQ